MIQRIERDDAMTNKEVARVLDINESTVKPHAKHIFDKLQVTRRAHMLSAERAGADRS